MTRYAITPPGTVHLDIVDSDEKFPVRRIYCIGKNYVAHIHEMNADERDPPVIFMKPTDAVVANGGTIPTPSSPRTCTTRANWSWRSSPAATTSPRRTPSSTSSATASAST